MTKTSWFRSLQTLISASPQSQRRRLRRKTHIESLENRALLAAQVFEGTPLTQAARANTAVEVDINYSTLDDQGDPAQILTSVASFRLHFDSSALTYDGGTNVFAGNTGLQIQADTSDFDNDASTDSFLLASWFDISNNFPGIGVTQPVRLLTANFTTADPFDSDTTLNITRPDGSAPPNLTDVVTNSPTITQFIEPDVTISDITVTEGGNANFTVSLDENPSGQVTVDYTTQTGTAGAADFTAETNQLVFNPGGPLNQTISIATTADSIVEINEQFSVLLSNAVNATIVDATGIGTITDDDQVFVSVSDAGNVSEGGTANFDLSLDQAPLSNVTVVVSTVAGTADSNDYSAISNQSFTFTPANWDTPQSVVVAITDDSDPEADETFSLDIVSVTGGLESNTNGSGTATILANDPPTISIVDPAAVVEGNVVMATVMLSAVPAETLTVNFATSHGTTDDSDFTESSGTLTFQPGDPQSQTISIGTSNDTLVELTETFLITLNSASNGTISDGTATASILDNDVPLISIEDAGTVAEGNNAQFRIFLDQPPVVPLSFTVSSVDGTATAGSDYTGTTLDGTFLPGEGTELFLMIGTLNDSDIEADETFTVLLSNVTSGTIGDSSGLATITSEDIPVVSISDASPTAEGNNISFDVSLNALPLPGQDVTVEFATADGTAVAGDDYTAITDSLTFTSAGPLTQTVIVPTTNDSLVENNENLTANLSNVTAATLGTASGSATITSEDVPAISIVQEVSGIDGSNVNFANTENIIFRLTLDQAPVAPVTVVFDTADLTATAGLDYTAISSQTVSFAVGQLTETVEVQVLDDALVENDETLTGALSSATGASIAVATATATIDSADTPVFEITGATPATEGSNAIFTVSIDQAPETGVPAIIGVRTVSGTAISDSDFTAVDQTLTFTAGGANSQQVTVELTDDGLVELQESFIAELHSSGNFAATNTQATGSIIDNDVPTISVSDQTVNEGDDLVFIVSLDQAPISDVTVQYATADGTAISPDDFAAASDTLTFTPDGQISQQVTISTVDDSLLEDLQETLTLQLSNPTGATISDAVGNGILVNDDNVTVQISDASTAVEGGSAIFTITLNEAPNPTQDVSFTLTAVSGTATSGTDFEAYSQTITFTDEDELTRSISINITDDDLVEPDETFTLQITNTVNATVLDAEGTATISSEDLPIVTVSNAPTVEEGNVSAFTVTLDQAPVSAVTVTISTVNATAAAPEDFDAVTDRVLTFNPGEGLTQTFEVDTINDTVGETTEAFEISITATAAELANSTATATILDDEFTTRPVLNPFPRFTTNELPTLTWQPIDDAAEYEVWFSRIFPGIDRLFEDDSTVTSSAFTPPEDLTPGLYRMWVRGFGQNGGTGPWSAPVEFEIRPTLQDPVIPTFSRRPTFLWDEIPHATAYEIFIRTTGGDLIIDSITNTRYTPVVDLPAGPVFWWIRSSDATFNNGWSNRGTTGIRTTVLTPDGVSTDTSPTFSWREVEGAGRYVLHVQNVDTGAIAIREDRVTSTSFTVPTSLPAGRYRTWVKAIDAATDDFARGQWSVPVDFEVTSNGQDGDLPSLDTQLVAPDANVNVPRPTIQWTTAEGASRYRVYLLSLTDNSVVVDDATIIGNTYTPDVDLSGNYRVWVRAISSTNRQGDWSPVLTFNVTVTDVENHQNADFEFVSINNVPRPTAETAVKQQTEPLRTVAEPAQQADTVQVDNVDQPELTVWQDTEALMALLSAL